MRVGGGDLNARTKQILDFIPEIDGDMVPPRQNPDNNKNSHGDCFISFLKENQSVILNGRITPNLNNYTFVSTRGCSVPDYLFCDIDNLSMCSEMKTMLISDIINDNNLTPPRILPDHSLLCATFITIFYNSIDKHLPSANNYIPCQIQCQIQQNIPKLPPRKNARKITKNFMLNDCTRQQIFDTIKNIENSQKKPNSNR